MKRIASSFKGILKCIVLLFHFASFTQKKQNDGILVKNALDFNRNELISLPYPEFIKLVGDNVKESVFGIISS